MTYDKYSEVIEKFEKAYNLPARPTQHYVIDECEEFLSIFSEEE